MKHVGLFLRGFTVNLRSNLAFIQGEIVLYGMNSESLLAKVLVMHVVRDFDQMHRVCPHLEEDMKKGYGN